MNNVETYRLIDSDEMRAGLQETHELVFKRVDGSGGKDMLIGPYATAAELDRDGAEWCAPSPRAWIAQTNRVALDLSHVDRRTASCPVASTSGRSR